MTVGAVCNREVVVIERDASILEAARLMREYHVGDVVVTEPRQGGPVPVGILTDRDIVVGLVAKEVDLKTIAVGDAMSFELLTVREDEDLLPTIEQMCSRGVRRVPVVNSAGALVGILAVDDLIELVAELLADLVKLITFEQKREQEFRGD